MEEHSVWTTPLARPALAALATLAAVGTLTAEPPAPRKVKVTLLVILASEKGDTVDERLTCIAEQVRKKDPRLKSFRMGAMMCASLSVDQKKTFPLVEDAKAHVVVRRPADKQNKVELEITPPRGGEIGYQTVCGKFLPVVTRYETRDRECLILAVRVEPCKGK
jgi:hypothetical protein